MSHQLDLEERDRTILLDLVINRLATISIVDRKDALNHTRLTALERSLRAMAPPSRPRPVTVGDRIAAGDSR